MAALMHKHVCKRAMYLTGLPSQTMAGQGGSSASGRGEAIMQGIPHEDEPKTIRQAIWLRNSCLRRQGLSSIFPHDDQTRTCYRMICSRSECECVNTTLCYALGE